MFHSLFHRSGLLLRKGSLTLLSFIVTQDIHPFQRSSLRLRLRPSGALTNIRDTGLTFAVCPDGGVALTKVAPQLLQSPTALEEPLCGLESLRKLFSATSGKCQFGTHVRVTAINQHVGGSLEVYQSALLSSEEEISIDLSVTHHPVSHEDGEVDDEVLQPLPPPSNTTPEKESPARRGRGRPRKALVQQSIDASTPSMAHSAPSTGVTAQKQEISVQSAVDEIVHSLKHSAPLPPPSILSPEEGGPAGRGRGRPRKALVQQSIDASTPAMAHSAPSTGVTAQKQKISVQSAVDEIVHSLKHSEPLPLPSIVSPQKGGAARRDRSRKPLAQQSIDAAPSEAVDGNSLCDLSPQSELDRNEAVGTEAMETTTEASGEPSWSSVQSVMDEMHRVPQQLTAQLKNKSSKKKSPPKVPDAWYEPLTRKSSNSTSPHAIIATNGTTSTASPLASTKAEIEEKGKGITTF